MPQRTKFRLLMEECHERIEVAASELRAAQRRRLAVDLLRLVITKSIPDSLEELAAGPARGLRSRLVNLQKHLAQYKLTEALCAKYRYDQPRLRVLREWHINENDWQFIHQFADSLGKDLEMFLRSIEVDGFAWHDRLERDIISFEISIEPRALENMVIAAVEGYLSPPVGHKKPCEIYGLSLGMCSDRDVSQRHTGVSKIRYIHIMRALPQISAEMSPRGVNYKHSSLEVVLQASQGLFPHLRVLGDFHSHPYKDLAQLRADHGWRYSQGDQKDNYIWCEAMREWNERPEISFVMATTKKGQRALRFGRFESRPNTVQMSIGECHLIFAAYRILGSGDYSEHNVCLQLPQTLE